METMAALRSNAKNGQKIILQGVGTIGTILGTTTMRMYNKKGNLKTYHGYNVEVDGVTRFLPFENMEQWEMI